MSKKHLGATAPDLSSFCARVFYARNASGMTAAEAARKSGISAPAWHGLEKNSASSRHVFEMADALGVNPRWLATGKGPMREQVADFTLGEVVGALMELVESLDGEGRAAVVSGIVDCLKERVNPEQALAALETTLARAQGAQGVPGRLEKKTGAGVAERGFSSVLPTPETATTIGKEWNKKGPDAASPKQFKPSSDTSETSGA